MGEKKERGRPRNRLNYREETDGYQGVVGGELGELGDGH